MTYIIEQSTSANLVIGPLLNASGSVMVTLEIDNDAIGLYVNGGASAARSQTTSAASIGPGLYRIVLNTADTDTLGNNTIIVSGSGALLWRSDFQVWQPPTFNLFFDTTDEIATSADIAGLSATVAAVSAAVANVSAALLTSGEVSVINAQALSDYGAATSANVSVAVLQALEDQLLHTLLAQSASVTAVNNNSMFGLIMASADPNDFDRTSDSLAAIADGAGAVPLTSAETSVIAAQALSDYAAATSAVVSVAVLQALEDQLLHTLLAASASVTAVNDNSMFARIMASAAVEDFDRTSDSLRAINDQQLTSAGISAQVDTVLDNYNVASAGDPLTSAEVSVIVAQALSDEAIPGSAAISGIAAQALSDAALLASANASAAIEAAVFQRALDEPTGAPSWAGMNFDVAIEWVAARNYNRQHQASTSVGLFNSADTQIASASVNITSTSANQALWIS